MRKEKLNKQSNWELLHNHIKDESNRKLTEVLAVTRWSLKTFYTKMKNPRALKPVEKKAIEKIYNVELFDIDNFDLKNIDITINQTN